MAIFSLIILQITIFLLLSFGACFSGLGCFSDSLCAPLIRYQKFLSSTPLLVLSLDSLLFHVPSTRLVLRHKGINCFPRSLNRFCPVEKLFQLSLSHNNTSQPSGFRGENSLPPLSSRTSKKLTLPQLQRDNWKSIA